MWPGIRAYVAGAGAALAIVLGVGCGGAQTSVTQVWQAPLPATAPMKSMLVFGARMDEASRRSLEDRFVAELGKHGVRALSSYAVFPGAPPDQEKARAKVNELGLEGILADDENHRQIVALWPSERGAVGRALAAVGRGEGDGEAGIRSALEALDRDLGPHRLVPARGRAQRPGQALRVLQQGLRDLRVLARQADDPDGEARPAFGRGAEGERDRLGRLITALAYNPFAVGLGLDEDTAAFIGPDETLEVEGTGGVTVVDASNVSFSSVDSASEGQPISILGLVVHVLTAGATFNLHTRQASSTALVQPRE